jgi:hypothetical protein
VVFTLIKVSNTGVFQFAIQETGLAAGSARCLVINADGSVLVGGQTTVNGVLLPTIISYTASGQKILTFGTNGVQTYNAFGAGEVNNLTVTSISNVVAAGQLGNSATLIGIGQSNNLLAQLDNGF